MKAKDIMTKSPKCCSSNDSLRTVAQMMRDNDCGAVPVIEHGGRVTGIVTDRDLAVRGFADGKTANATVAEVMTTGPRCCRADDDVRAVEKVMTDQQVRRVPIVDGDGRCVGIVSQADLARASRGGQQLSEQEVAIVVEQISVPRRKGFDRNVSENLEQPL